MNNDNQLQQGVDGAANLPPLSDSSSLPPAQTHYPFHFSGNAAEYFRIWIVNLLLSIITLGIYSAWAKVRKKRYFYGNTWVAESNFEFHGNPFSILKGRIIAVIALAAYSGAGYVSPRLAAALFLLLALAAPWFIARTFAFNAYYSSYRQIRFRNTATAKEVFLAIWPFLLIPVSALLFSPELDREVKALTAAQWIGAFLPLVIGVFAYPYVFGAIKRLHINRSLYGNAPFAMSAGYGSFYKIYFKAYLVLIAGVFAFGLIAAISLALLPAIAFVLLPLAYLLAGAFFLGYLRSRIGNLVFNSSTLADSAHFGSTLSATKLAYIYLTNLLAITVSLGLMVPWAAVRIARYRCESLMLECPGDLESFVAQAGQEVAATGEEIGEFFDFDLSL